MGDLLDALAEFNDNLWLIPFILILGIGLVSTFLLRGMQFTKIPEMIRVTFGKSSDTFSSFSIFCISMGNRIGVGNITGPILAIIQGGPGAIFWMWVFAIIGASTSYIETTVSQIYKKRNSEGEFEGGPCYNMLHGLKMPRAARFVAIVIVLMHFVGYMSMEACSISNSIGELVDFQYTDVLVGLGLVLLMIVIAMGGTRRISKISSWLIPVMAFSWILVCLIVMFAGKSGVDNSLGMIFESAFDVPALVGGGFGMMIIVATRRAVLSTEAGLGTATYISSKANVEHPAQQGLSQAFGSMFDIIICTLTALAVMSAFGSYAEIQESGMQSFELLNFAFDSSIGSMAPYLVAAFVFVFAFSSMMGDFVIGKSNITFISENKRLFYAFLAVMLSVLYISSIFASDRMFVVVDIFLALTTIVNCVILLFLGKHAVTAYRDYVQQKKEGIRTPVFDSSVLSDSTGVTEWNREAAR